MPYVKPDLRPDLEPISKAFAQTKGELNFQISRLLNAYIELHGRNYDRMADCRAACGDASSEFYRRVMGPYEDEKIVENGDVYSDSVLKPKCADCHGRGVIGVPYTHPTNPNLDDWSVTTCPTCKGRG